MTRQQEFRAAGIIGLPVAQSRSPQMYQWWRDKYGCPGAYLPMPVHPARLADALRGLRALGFVGCNVTMPHKIAALALVDRVDPLAEKIGATNLVIVEPDGTLTAYNTDGEGFMGSLREACPSWAAASGPVVVLGAGGGAASIVASLAAAGVPEIRLCNRTLSKADAMSEGYGPTVAPLPWASRHDALAGASLLINTTSLGMAGNNPLDLSLAALPADAVVADIIYNPLSTALLAAAAARGHRTMNGLGMLLHQGVPCFERYWGIRPEVTPELYQAIAVTL
jgi:shikimate dehydrogenase